MTCPGCKRRMRAAYKYPVKGGRKYKLPGVVHVYRCRACARELRTLEVTETHLSDYRQQWEALRQKQIQEIASLKSKVMALTHSGGLTKMQRVRLELLQVIEHTLT